MILQGQAPRGIGQTGGKGRRVQTAVGAQSLNAPRPVRPAQLQPPAPFSPQEPSRWGRGRSQANPGGCRTIPCSTSSSARKIGWKMPSASPRPLGWHPTPRAGTSVRSHRSHRSRKAMPKLSVTIVTVNFGVRADVGVDQAIGPPPCRSGRLAELRRTAFLDRWHAPPTPLNRPRGI